MKTIDLLKAFDEDALISELIERGNFEVISKEALKSIRKRFSTNGYFDHPVHPGRPHDYECYEEQPVPAHDADMIPRAEHERLLKQVMESDLTLHIDASAALSIDWYVEVRSGCLVVLRVPVQELFRDHPLVITL